MLFRPCFFYETSAAAVVAVVPSILRSGRTMVEKGQKIVICPCALVGFGQIFVPLGIFLNILRHTVCHSFEQYEPSSTVM